MNSNYTTLISGGSRGIGKATADFFIEKDKKVLAPDSKELNVASLYSIENYLATNLALKPSLKIENLILNAGIFIETPIETLDLEKVEKVLDINLMGNFRLLKVFEKYLIDGASIIFIGSTSGSLGEKEGSAYAASKAALYGLTKSLALELAYRNIRVNLISPGWVETDLALKQLHHDENLIQANLGASLQDRWLKPAEIAASAYYLCSDAARGITGQELKITAGLDL